MNYGKACQTKTVAKIKRQTMDIRELEIHFPSVKCRETTEKPQVTELCHFDLKQNKEYLEGCCYQEQR